MFYVLSKIAFFIIAPSHLCLILLGLGIVLLTWQSTQRLARWSLIISLTGFVVFGFSPVGNALLLPLEQRFPRPEAVAAGQYAGIIMLGGFEDGDISQERKTLALNEAAERLSETVRLARKLPQAKVIFSGGAGSILLQFRDAREAVETYLRDVGISSDRLILESKSRNTWENAVFLKTQLKPRADQRFLLVTSAWHMPRAVGVFRRVGIPVVAYP
ncbi:MAG: YdcF family protein, partial [Hyphomicrobiales bacterium]|nr:YdcF family protein [Hyphomicrobiales bacterium]